MNTIALVGNPNSGKTTLFNALTGSNQRVGNWPGVTVEKKEGSIKFKDKQYTIIDLPGAYSLGSFSEDEVVARDFILKGNPDVVINVVDATNIERNLYLTIQLLEMGAKVVVALNMIDEAKAKKIEIDINTLSQKLGVPIVPTIASKRKGIEELVSKAIELMEKDVDYKAHISYGESIDKEIENIKKVLSSFDLDYPADWIAVKVLEGDPYVLSKLEKDYNLSKSTLLKDLAEKEEDLELEVIDKRYEYINNITREAVKLPDEHIETLSDKIDKVITHKFLALPIFGLIMFIVFQLTFAIGEDFLGGYIGGLIEILGSGIENILISFNAPDWLISFFTEGIVGGIGTVLEFVPLIVVLYMLMGILEDSGYMARAAYIMDNIMRALGLHGKSFISMIIGFGCNVPGVMSTRTLENKKDRMISILINPFMSCGARIQIYLVFISAFFPDSGGLVLFSLYFLGILVALIMAKIFSKTLFKGESSYFIMELPPYRMPTIRNVLRNMWDNVSEFLVRAGTVIFFVVSILWVLAMLPVGVEAYSQESILGKIGTLIAPIFVPAGYGTWQAAVGLFSGIAAKEAVVAILGMVYAGVEEGSALVNAIQSAFTPLSAVSFMVMTLLYTPCAATLGAIKKETGSLKWTAFSALYSFAIAWLVSVLVYQVGSAIGLG
ncbi:MAG: ferrous iron transport protein B [Tissierellia bacterium]|nr:ferrous iron transport protein B [Tissierellia bacterium]